MSKTEVKEIVIIDEYEEVSPPSEVVSSVFGSLQEWLFSICDKENPKNEITNFRLGLFESADCYTIFLVGENSHDKDKYHSITTVDFEPSDIYFRLPEKEYGDLDREQVLNKIRTQLKEFTNTEKFKSSFFVHAKSIRADFDDDIWVR